MTRRTRPGRSRALRYGAGTSALVLLVCALIAGLSFWTLVTVGGQVTGATAGASGEVVRAAVDRAASGVAFSGLIAAIVLITVGWQVISRRRLRRRTGQPMNVRRVRVQSGLMTRSWLELDSPAPDSTTQRWIPVHFDPVLVTLPAPTTVQVHGDPRRRGLAAAEVDGVWLDPSGPIRTTEPRGRRIDSPTRPDPDARHDTSWRQQLRADSVLLTPTPVVGLLWVYLDGGGLATWMYATAMAATLALWWAALHGTDPT